MTAHVRADTVVDGIRAITLENPLLRLDVLPSLGAKIYNLVDLVTGKNLLWHNPRQLPTPAPFGSNFDNVWSGGWDEVFPNGAECEWQDDVQPFLGELWTRPWVANVIAEGPDTCVHLTVDATITPARVEKWIRLDPSAPIVRFHHRITNVGYEPFEYMWGMHPALAVAPGHRIDIPAAGVTVDQSRDGKLGVPGETYAWPNVVDASGRAVDLREVMPPSALTYGLLYAHGLTDGWIAVSDPTGGPSVALAFPRDVFSSVWLWLVYGGWRGFHHIVVEPWTGFPSRITDAATAGRLRRLEPGESLDAELTAVIYRGLRSVTSVSPDGEVTGTPL
jgi:galactose mutarotase-like enzyme